MLNPEGQRVGPRMRIRTRRSARPDLPPKRIHQRWVSNGFAGEMTYLHDRRAEVRNDPRNLLRR